MGKSEEAIFYGVVGKDGNLVVVDNKPYCLTTYKPAAECAITFVDRDGRNGYHVKAQGPLSLKQFRVVDADVVTRLGKVAERMKKKL